MGVLNVTPDSFSDGGKYTSTKAAVQQAISMTESGAYIIDIGGESSRPGAKPVSEEEEMKRALPVIKALINRRDAINRVSTSKQWYISIDTYKPAVAEAALLAGANIVNDITGLQNAQMRSVVAKYNCPVVLMHMLGTPQTMQKQPRYTNVVQDITNFFKQQILLAKQAGIKREQIILDPGIGFGKTLNHNLKILRNISQFEKLKLPILIGASRKSMIEKITGAKTEDRLPGTLALHLWATQQGADILRVHDVAEHTQALKIQEKLH